jgi:hypothetical protein
MRTRVVGVATGIISWVGLAPAVVHVVLTVGGGPTWLGVRAIVLKLVRRLN